MNKWNKICGIRRSARAAWALTVEIHVPGIIAVLVLPDGLADWADQRDGQQTTKQHEDLKVGDTLDVGQLQRRPSGILCTNDNNVIMQVDKWRYVTSSDFLFLFCLGVLNVWNTEYFNVLKTLYYLLVAMALSTFKYLQKIGFKIKYVQHIPRILSNMLHLHELCVVSSIDHHAVHPLSVPELGSPQ